MRTDKKYRKAAAVLLLITAGAAAVFTAENAAEKNFSETDTGIRYKAVEADADTDEELPAKPDISAETAVLIEAGTGRILFEREKDRRMYPASTTKMMTALIASEMIEDAAEISGSTDDELKKKYKVSENCAGAEGSSIFLKKDEIITIEDLLYGMMLRSGNDAALAVAEYTAGSIADFTEMMNQRAAALGLENTHFCNPNGLQDENHYSSAHDLALIAREGMRHDIFRDTASTKVWNASREGADNYNYFYNKNKTLFQYEGATGIKIGYTRAAGRCLAASAEKNGMELIAVVLNAPDWFQDVYKLFDYGFGRYNNVTVCDAEKRLTGIKVKGGERKRVCVGTREKISCPSHKGEKTEISVEYELPEIAEAPVSRWQEAGRLHIYSADEYVYSVPLYYMEDVDASKSE